MLPINYVANLSFVLFCHHCHIQKWVIPILDKNVTNNEGDRN